MAKEITKKRKIPKDSTSESKASSKRRAVASDQSQNEQAKIEELEAQISESRKYYNNIATLISMLNVDNTKVHNEQPNLAVTVALCRVFCRLIAGGNLQLPSKASEQEQIVVGWLKERLQEYQNALLDIIRYADSSSQITALTLSMRLVNMRATHIPEAEVQVWTTGLFQSIFEALIEAENGELVRTEFVEKFVKEFDDVRFYTFQKISSYASGRSFEILERLIWTLSQCDSAIPQDYKFTKFHGQQPSKKEKSKSPLLSVNSHRRWAQDAWLAILRSSNLSEAQRKSLLKRMAHTIAPWFLRPELLMDFLTDSYNAGGSTALLALSGLFYLIQERNLDYPHFYTKLYSLLDSELLHSKHRSRFFRLLDTFLASTHLPATLVASFVKRLSRLALNAPPSAIVAIVPFAYNLLKTHPTCTFMIHRDISNDIKKKAKIEAQGMDDPFLVDETDPTLTRAIESSLWEIESLQSHYHPNVAAIARIISEQFTKQSYTMEDFLDYSYQGMLMAELGAEEKTFRKAPVVEFQIPKRIFTDRLLLEEDGGKDAGVGSLLRRVVEFPVA